jgi:predicted DsbA family dithiol-disulfide isomerase
MAKSSLDSVTESVPLDVEWRAFELRPEGSPPMDPAYRARVNESWPRVQQMGREFGVVMNSHRFGVNTRPAHQAYKVVQRLAPEQADAFNEAVYRAYWEFDQDIGDPDVLAQLAEDLGVDGDALRQSLAAGEALAEVIAEEEMGYMSGISGVPAFVFMDKYLVSGVRPPDQLQAIIAQIREREGLE